MSEWADENSELIREMGLDYKDVICTSFALSNRPALVDFYKQLKEESKIAVFDAINQYALPEPISIYETQEGFVLIVKRCWNFFCRWTGADKFKINININEGIRDLLIRLGWSQHEAELLAENNLKQ